VKRSRRLAGAVGGLLGLQAAAVGIYWLHDRSVAEPAPSQLQVERVQFSPAPPLEVEAPDGTKVQLSELRGRPLILHFWATWCAPCVDELPEVLSLAAALDPNDAQVLAVSVDESWSNIETFFSGAVPKEVVRAAKPEQVATFSGNLLPRTFVLNAAGQQAFRALGARRWDPPQVRDLLRTLD